MLALMLGEGLTRALIGRPDFEPRSADNLRGLLVPDSARGWIYAPGFRGVAIRGRDTIPIAINDLGLRDRPLERSDSAAFRLLALGDSYTAGWGVRVEEGWPSRLERKLAAAVESSQRVRVINGGVSGYNSSQILQQARILLARLAPKIVVLAAYADGADRLTDPYVLRDGDLIRRTQVDRLVPVPGGYLNPPERRPKLRKLALWLDMHQYFAAWLLHVAYQEWERLRPGPPVGPGGDGTAVESGAAVASRLGPFLADLDSLNSTVRNAHAQLVVVFVTRQGSDGHFFARERRLNQVILAHCRAENIPAFDPTQALEDSAHGRPRFRLGEDLHWTPAAYSIMAAFLVDSLYAHRLIPAQFPELSGPRFDSAAVARPPHTEAMLPSRVRAGPPIAFPTGADLARAARNLQGGA